MFVCSLCCCNPLYLYYILGRTEGIGKKKKSGSIHIPFGSRNSPLFCGKNAALYILQNKKSFSKTFFSPLPVREKFSESLRQLVDGDYLRILRFNDIVTLNVTLMFRNLFIAAMEDESDVPLKVERGMEMLLRKL